MHETTWKPKTVGTAAPARCTVAQNWQNDNAGCSTSYWSECKFGIPMVPEISRERRKRIGTHSGTRTSYKALNISKRTTFINFVRRSIICGVFNRSLDIETSIAGNSQSVWYSIPSVSCLETFKQHGTKLPEAGTSCSSKERRNHSAMEAIQVAPYKKNAERLNAHLIFIDESGFLIIPNVKRTWAFRGQTPFLYHLYRQDRISTINALSVSPKRKRLALYIRMRTRNLNGLDVRSFLQHLLRHLRGNIIVLWDRGKIHQRLAVQQYIESHPRLHIEWFPSYAPELNPAEYVWNYNDSRLSNSVYKDFKDLQYRLRNSMQRIKRSQDLLWSCIYAADLPWVR